MGRAKPYIEANASIEPRQCSCLLRLARRIFLSGRGRNIKLLSSVRHRAGSVSDGPWPVVTAIAPHQIAVTSGQEESKAQLETGKRVRLTVRPRLLGLLCPRIENPTGPRHHLAWEATLCPILFQAEVGNSSGDIRRQTFETLWAAFGDA